MGYRESARDFVENERQFQLGFLVTEQSHPATRTLGETTRRSPVDGVRQLLSVDHDIVAAAPAQLGGSAFPALAHALGRAAVEGRRIVFSGCGSTGRLAVLLESIWRRAWTRLGSPERARLARGIITGGDRALIRSVESFEDYADFGREQVRELALRPGDLFVAISEGGETSSVIGSAWQALEDGCEVFFVFNNPTDLLVDRIERSRALIADERVTPVDLTTGPMALSGSTRMQATTAELLFIGAAMEAAIRAAAEHPGAEVAAAHGAATAVEAARVAAEAPASFRRIVDRLLETDSVGVLAELVEREASVYEKGSMVLYCAGEHLLDIFADTTERTPTFSVPPLKRSTDGDDVPNPWSAAYDRRASSADAWHAMLGRDPVGLDWDASTYARLGTPSFATSPPRLGRDEILSYPVGREVEERYRANTGLALEVEWVRNGASAAVRVSTATQSREIPLDVPAGEIDLFGHIGMKLVFNTLSTATMALLGRVRGNWMTQVAPTNKKLIDRSIRIVADLRSIDYRSAAELVFRELETRGGATASLVQEIVDRR
jgi:N-acetylmuramic acid 6-phosphate etherase